ncbi:MAG: hypothetical protein QF570_11760 [Myxococcota bacterium]|nr:hypothetical protein [Myxococcota bacterium]
MLIAEATDELDRWVPSLTTGLGMLMQDISGDIGSTDLLGPFDHTSEVINPISVVRPPTSGEDLTLTPLFCAGLEFMTPGLRAIPFAPEIEVPGAPRLFVHGEVIPAFGLTYRTAKEGDPSPNRIGAPYFPPNNLISERVVFGQGSVIESQVQQWSYAAGAGIAMTLDVFGRRFRLKPSFEWMTEKVQMTGEARRAVAVIAEPRVVTDFRYEVFKAAKTKRFHGLGVGLEFELDTRRAGPFLLSVFGNARGYRFMGSGKIRAKASNIHGEEVTYQIKRDRYGYRATTGIRLRLAVE